MDPVAQQRPQPDQLRRCRSRPAAGAPPAARSTPPAAGPRAAAAPKSRRPTLSFFSRAEAIALHCSGWTTVRLEAVVLQQLHQPPPAVRGLERRRGARRQAADHRQDRRHAVVHVAVGEHLAILIDDRHLGALAVHVDSDVDRHCRAPSRARMSPGTYARRAEQERGPALCPALIGSGQPPRDSGIFHVRAKTALTEPVRHRIRQLSGSGEGQDRTRHDHGGGEDSVMITRRRRSTSATLRGWIRHRSPLPVRSTRSWSC